MWNNILLALAATVLIVAGVLLLTWAMAQTWGDFSRLFQHLRHRAQHPWEDEDRALEELQDKVRRLDPELLGPTPEEDTES